MIDLLLDDDMKQDAKNLLRLFRLSRRFSSGRDTSFANERSCLEAIVSALSIKCGHIVDVAASDGYTQSCTRGLFGRAGWVGLALEMDPDKFYRLSYLYRIYDNVALSRIKATPKNICDIFIAHSVPQDFDVFNLDIDSYDLYIMEAVLQGGYRPKIVTIEINEKIPPGIYFAVKYDPAHRWAGDHFYGCSLDAASVLLKSHGYLLKSLEYNNAFFVNTEIAQGCFDDQSISDAYSSGYLNRPDRAKLFPWNYDMDELAYMSVDGAILELEKKFSAYKGKYDLSRVD